ncbi:hypothetical protein HPB48_017550 [Haemaphysalis longicornis]|uniref:Uncharacterized protein n=1 Tax=Haemaphysalis longicornis TaxID=44386 RepID=A0A9J6GG00_HAELO|nr:hypothetical protein HPB48_017550 [Haemaphysalis longicornis]
MCLDAVARRGATLTMLVVLKRAFIGFRQTLSKEEHGKKRSGAWISHQKSTPWCVRSTFSQVILRELRPIEMRKLDD